jgi:hypothetical protein
MGRCPFVQLRLIQRLRDIRDQIGRVFDANRQPDCGVENAFFCGTPSYQLEYRRAARRPLLVGYWRARLSGVHSVTPYPANSLTIPGSMDFGVLKSRYPSVPPRCFAMPRPKREDAERGFFEALRSSL